MNFKFIFGLGLMLFFAATAGGQQLGASLYVVPPQTDPPSGSNFTLTIKVDSLGAPINAIKGDLRFNKDRLEIISVSKIGSLLNLWVEEPQFSNRDGALKFSGGVPRPGFIGNGGTVLLVIFKAKVPGPANLTWQSAEVLAADGKGSNILSNLQNLTFLIEESADRDSAWNTGGFLVWWNVILTLIFVVAVLFFAGRWLLRYHDIHAHNIFKKRGER